MFNLKTALKGAAAGFVISFIAGIIGRVDFLIILLRAFLSALFSGALFGGLGVLYSAFLGGGSDAEFSPGVSKASPSGSVVDITLTDDDLPDSDTAPDFAIAPNAKVFDTSSAASDNSELAEPSAVHAGGLTAPVKTVGSAEPPPVRQSEKTAAAVDVFEPIALGKASSAVSSSEVPPMPSAASFAAAVPAGSVSGSAIPPGADDVVDAEDPSAEAADPGSQADGGLIDNLPDMDGFSADEEYFEEDNDDTFGAVSPRGPASHTSRGDNPVDISDAKNIADAIRTALKKES